MFASMRVLSLHLLQLHVLSLITVSSQTTIATANNHCSAYIQVPYFFPTSTLHHILATALPRRHATLTPIPHPPPFLIRQLPHPPTTSLSDSSTATTAVTSHVVHIEPHVPLQDGLAAARHFDQHLTRRNWLHHLCVRQHCQYHYHLSTDKSLSAAGASRKL